MTFNFVRGLSAAKIMFRFACVAQDPVGLLIAFDRHHSVVKIQLAAATKTDHVAPDQTVALFGANKK